MAAELLIVLFALVFAIVFAFAGFEWDQAHPLSYKAPKPSALREWFKRNFGVEMKD
jgi:hypothetical protein